MYIHLICSKQSLKHLKKITEHAEEAWYTVSGKPLLWFGTGWIETTSGNKMEPRDELGTLLWWKESRGKRKKKIWKLIKFFTYFFTAQSRNSNQERFQTAAWHTEWYCHGPWDNMDPIRKLAFVPYMLIEVTSLIYAPVMGFLCLQDANNLQMGSAPEVHL